MIMYSLQCSFRKGDLRANFMNGSKVASANSAMKKHMIYIIGCITLEDFEMGKRRSNSTLNISETNLLESVLFGNTKGIVKKKNAILIVT